MEQFLFKCEIYAKHISHLMEIQIIKYTSLTQNLVSQYCARGQSALAFLPYFILVGSYKKTSINLSDD